MKMHSRFILIGFLSTACTGAHTAAIGSSTAPSISPAPNESPSSLTKMTEASGVENLSSTQAKASPSAAPHSGSSGQAASAVASPATATSNKGGLFAYFIPGNYALTDGDEDQCGEGEFMIEDHAKDKTKTLMLGPRNGFKLQNKKGVLTGDAPGDEKCKYEFENSLQHSGTEDTVHFTDVRKCSDVEKYKMMKIAHVYKTGVIKLTVKQVGDPKFEYHCSWRFAPDADTSGADADD